MRRDNDIKAPDGYLLGGIRRVHKDGSILFQRGYWQAPVEWAGERVWVHEARLGKEGIEVAPPGCRLFAEGAERRNIYALPIDRPDAKPTFRRPEIRAYIARMTGV